jgi:cytochrome c5
VFCRQRAKKWALLRTGVLFGTSRSRIAVSLSEVMKLRSDRFLARTLVVALVLTWALAIGLASAGRPPAPQSGGAVARVAPAATRPSPSTASQAQPANGFVGDETCAACHEPEGISLKNTLHGKSQNPRTPAGKAGLFVMDPATRQPAALASVTGHFYLRDDLGHGWVAGWWNTGLVVLRAETREVVRLEERNGERPSQVAIADTVLGVAASSEDGSAIRLYPMASLRPSDPRSVSLTPRGTS